MKKILITGTAGFIGYHLSELLLSQGYEVVGLDSVNDYYDVKLKQDRLNNLGIDCPEEFGVLTQSTKHSAFRFIRLQLEDKKRMLQLFKEEGFNIVINLAAQAGVRYSLTNPEAYVESNITGFLNILESCRFYPVENLIYASSSSVYGLNSQMPFSVHNGADHPVSLYAASKKSNELMAHTYSHLFGIPTIGLRFFTVYGPWGRPDMALFLFTEAILEGRAIEIFNHGNMQRDFTYVADIVQGISKMLEKAPGGANDWNSASPDPAVSSAPYRIYNIGNNSPVKLMDFIAAIEMATGIQAKKIMKPLQAGDVERTWADVNDLIEDFGYKPSTPIEQGVGEFVSWFRKYYNK